MELKDTNQNIKKKYKYHYMNNKKEMVFRYDNAKHHPELFTFPHHKHTIKEIAESCEPELIDVLTEIQEKIDLEGKGTGHPLLFQVCEPAAYGSSLGLGPKMLADYLLRSVKSPSAKLHLRKLRSKHLKLGDMVAIGAWVM